MKRIACFVLMLACITSFQDEAFASQDKILIQHFVDQRLQLSNSYWKSHFDARTELNSNFRYLPWLNSVEKLSRDATAMLALAVGGEAIAGAAAESTVLSKVSILKTAFTQYPQLSKFVIKLGVSGGVSGIASFAPKEVGFDLNSILIQANAITAQLGSLEIALENEPNADLKMTSVQRSFVEYLSAISKVDQLFEIAENELFNQPTTLRTLWDYGNQQANFYFLELQHYEFLMSLDTTEIAALHHFRAGL